MTVRALEEAVSRLSPQELSEFRAWYLRFDAEAWDRQIERDAASGALDLLADEALRKHRAGETREL